MGCGHNHKHCHNDDDTNYTIQDVEQLANKIMAADRKFSKKVIHEICRVDESILTENAKVLDFGCGDGALSREVSIHVGQVIGIDTNAKKVDIYNHIAYLQGLEENEMKAYKVDLTVESLNINDSFNVIMSCLCYHHVDDLDSITRKLYELLAGNGVLMVVDFDYSGLEFSNTHPGTRPGIIRAAFKAAGLVNVFSKTITQVTKYLPESTKVPVALTIGRREI